MKKIRLLAVVAALILWAVPVHSSSAQVGITLSNASIASPIDALESELYADLVIDSFYDYAAGVYLLSGEVVKDLSLAKFSGVYDPATQLFSGDYLINFTPVVSEKGSEVYTLTGTFTGELGTGGSVSLQLNGTIKYDKWNFEIDDQGYPLFKDYLEETQTSGDSRQATFIVTGEAPERGMAEADAEEESILPTEPTGPACQPQTHGLDPAKPGDVISPGAVYVDASGKEVGIIQERWFLNGTNTTSITWDGQPVQVELQYTCLDHSAGSIASTIPAYQEPPAGPTPGGPSPSTGPTSSTGGIGPLGIAAIAGAAVAVVAGAGVSLGHALKSANKTPPASKPPASGPPSPAPSRPPLETSQTSTPRETIDPPRPRPAQLTPEENARLTGIRNEMEEEIKQIKERWQQTRAAAIKLKTLKKKNLLKFLVKQGFDVGDWVMNSPVEVINKVTVEPVMEKAFEKHDTSQDGNIIVKIHNRIESMEADMQQMVKEVKYLESEVNKINRSLGGSGG